MKEQYIIIESSVDVTPEALIQRRLRNLGAGWQIVGQPNTIVALAYYPDGSVRYTKFVTTVVVEKTADPTPETVTHL